MKKHVSPRRDEELGLQHISWSTCTAPRPCCVRGQCSFFLENMPQCHLTRTWDVCNRASSRVEQQVRYSRGKVPPYLPTYLPWHTWASVYISTCTYRVMLCKYRRAVPFHRANSTTFHGGSHTNLRNSLLNETRSLSACLYLLPEN